MNIVFPHHKRVFSACNALLFTAGVCIGPVYCAAQTLPIRHFTTSEGLPSNHITSLCQDTKGFLWIGTDEGLTIYDGVNFKTFTVSDGLPNPYVMGILESRKYPGRIWISTITSGIAVYERGAFSARYFGKEFPNTYAGGIVEDDTGAIWCSTTKGIFKTSGDSLLHVPEFPNEYLVGGDIARGADGTMWIGINRKLYTRSPSGTVTGTIDIDFHPKGVINHMAVDQDGDLWISGTDSTLRRFVGGGETAMFNVGPSGVVTDALTDRDGDLWITTSRGLLRGKKTEFPGGLRMVFTTAGAPTDDILEPILEDREGEIWFGGKVSGVSKISQKNSTILDIPNEGSAVTDVSGHVWFKGRNGLLECRRDRGNSWSTFRHTLDSPSPSMDLLDLNIDARGNLWLRYADRSLTCLAITARTGKESILKNVGVLRQGKDFPTAYIALSYIDDKNYLWLAKAAGIGIIDLNASPPKYIGELRYPEDIHCLNVRAIYRDAKANVWIGGFAEGLDELVGGDLQRREIRHYTTADGLPDNGVRSLTEDLNGRMWIGTRFGGVSIYDGKRFYNFSINDGLPSNAIWSLSRDHLHRMWLGTGAGAVSVDIDSIPSLRWSSAQVSGACQVHVSPPTGSVWITNFRTVLVEQSATTPLAPPPIWITSVSVNNRQRDCASQMELSHLENNCSVDFTGISFRSDQPLRYEYRMIGIDSSWGPPARNRSVSYAALKPGVYTFEVRALTGDGKFSPSPAKLAFTIVPPVWERWWFRAALGIFFLSVGPYVYYRRVSRLEREKGLREDFAKRLIDSQEHERMRIASELHDSLGQNLLVIQNHTILAIDQSPPSSGIRERLVEISASTQQAIGDVREIALNLRPYHLDKLGLTTSINAIIRRISEASGIPIRSEVDPLDGLFAKGEESNIYRIIQEALNNIVKHSRATGAHVRLTRFPGRISIEIQDDGIGFDASSPLANGSDDALHGFGLIGMKERVRILGGTIEVSSSPGQGTSLHAEIPFMESPHV